MPRVRIEDVPTAMPLVEIIEVHAHPRRGTRGVRRYRRFGVPIGASHPSLARIMAERESALTRAAIYETDPLALYENPSVMRHPRYYAVPLYGELSRMRVRED